ncbi:MAG: F0F1 ATP synthase subunit epsilon [Bacillota bacterium]|jgi:F-type H+-transporting ATPase subunit epsilon
MAESSIKFEVVTPERVVLSLDIESVIVPGALGYLGVLPNHAPLITGLKVGVISYNKDGVKRKMAVSGGFMEVVDNKVVVLADTAELGEKIDVARAQAAKERAEKRLAERSSDLDIARAEFALKRALSRLEAAK